MDGIGTFCMTGALICRLVQEPCPSTDEPRPSVLYWGMGFQAFAAWMFWMRLTKLLYIVPNYGLMLLMTLRMLGDLWEFIVLLGFLFVSFSAQLHVWLSLWPHYLDVEGEHPVNIFFLTSWKLWYHTVMNGAPSEFIDTSNDPKDSIVMYAAGPMLVLFFVILVLLLLNLLIARFSKTFDLVYEQAYVNSTLLVSRLLLDTHYTGVAPRPFNMIRIVPHFVYYLMSLVSGKPGRLVEKAES